MRVCADDVGAALFHLDALVIMKAVFDEARACANLHLKPAKCVLIPLTEPFSTEVAVMMRTWLETHLHEWAGFLIQASSKYLGVEMGPAAEGKQWQPVFAKIKARTIEIAGAHAAASISAFLFNQRASPVLMYKAQLLRLPK